MYLPILRTSMPKVEWFMNIIHCVHGSMRKSAKPQQNQHKPLQNAFFYLQFHWTINTYWEFKPLHRNRTRYFNRSCSTTDKYFIIISSLFHQYYFFITFQGEVVLYHMLRKLSVSARRVRSRRQRCIFKLGHFSTHMLRSEEWRCPITCS